MAERSTQASHTHDDTASSMLDSSEQKSGEGVTSASASPLPLQHHHQQQTWQQQAKNNAGGSVHGEVMGPPLPPKHSSHSPRLVTTHEQPMSTRGGSMLPPPQFSFGPSGGNGADQWSVTSRHSLPPSYPSSQSNLAAPHLLAPRPSMHALSSFSLQYSSSEPSSHHALSSSSRMRGDGFLLDADDEPDGLDLSNSEASEPLPLQLQRGPSSGADPSDPRNALLLQSDERDADIDESDGHFMSAPSMKARPRSADVSGSSFLAPGMLSRHASTDSAPLLLVCPSCGEHPPSSLTPDGGESSFHAHVTRCFAAQHAAGRPPRTPQAQPSSSSSGDHGSSGGPIRKTRTRAASAAATTGSAAELASALAKSGALHSTPESSSGGGNGYHPYSHSNSPAGGHSSSHGSGLNAANLSQTLRQLRRTVDQLDVHQRISIMEAFHKLSRVATAEVAQQQAHAAQSSLLGVGASPRGKRFMRSATNSPSPKHKPVPHLLGQEDRVCKDILSLLYSPRITAPHPSPAVGGGGGGGGQGQHVGLPSPLVIGIPGIPGIGGGGAGAGGGGRQGSRSTAEMEAANRAAAGGLLPPPSILDVSSCGNMLMDTLELGPSSDASCMGGGGPVSSPLASPNNFLSFASLSSSPPPVRALESSGGSGLSELSSPIPTTSGSGGTLSNASGSGAATLMETENGGGSESDGGPVGQRSALALTGAFVQGISSSGASSPVSSAGGEATCSEQTSPSLPNATMDRSISAGGGAPRFPAHCHAAFPETNPRASSTNTATTSAQVQPHPHPVSTAQASSTRSESVSPDSPDPNSARMREECTPDVADKQRMMRRTTAAARG